MEKPKTKTAWHWYEWGKEMARQGKSKETLDSLFDLDLPNACKDGIESGIRMIEHAKKVSHRIQVMIDDEWRSVRPTGGEPYTYESRIDAELMLEQLYPDADRSTVRAVPVDPKLDLWNDRGEE